MHVVTISHQALIEALIYCFMVQYLIKKLQFIANFFFFTNRSSVSRNWKIKESIFVVFVTAGANVKGEIDSFRRYLMSKETEVIFSLFRSRLYNISDL